MRAIVLRVAIVFALAVIARETTTVAQGGQARGSRRVTFTEDVAPILTDHCVTCHRPGGAAPFSLLTYDAARQRATQIAAVTKSRFMPPWKAEPGYGDFVGQTHLTDGELDVLQRWVAAGTPEGSQVSRPPREWPDGWQLGQPDVVVTLPAYQTPSDASDDLSRVFVVPIPIDATRYIKGLEFRPGNPRVVHHANIRIDSTSASRELDERDPLPGYDGLIARSAVYPDGYFLGWTPGQIAPLLPKGMAWRVGAGTDLVVQVHLRPGGRSETVQPSIGLYFTPDPPERTPAMLRLGRQNIDIAAGDKEYTVTDSFVLPVDVDVQAVQPHAHYLAHDVRGIAVLPDGTTKWLIWIKDWDFRWQHVYRYVTPIALPKGTRLTMRYTYDNSAGNARNPRQPPVRVSWGQWSNDEMGDLWIQVLTRDERDREILNAAFAPKVMTEDLVGYETMIAAQPARVSLRNDAAVMYLDLGRPNDAATHFEAVARLQPQSAVAHYNFATALVLAGRTEQSVTEFTRALEITPDYASAHNNLGNVLLRSGKADEAERHFREALRLDPKNADVHYNMASLWLSRSQIAFAIDELEQASQLKPEGLPALANLAWLRAVAPDAASRNAEEAIRLASRLVALTNRRDASALDVLAAAYAAAGQFERAVALCDEALALKPDATLASAVHARQQLYREGQPFSLRE